MLISYSDLEERTGKTKRQLSTIVYTLQIKSKIIDGFAFFTEEQAEEITNYKKPVRSTKYRTVKVSIIEEYLRTGSARKTASILRIPKERANETVREWKKTGYVVVESSMNFSDKDYKNILKRGGNYCYSYTYKGKCFWKAGFKTQEEAFEALCKLKEELRIEK